MSSNRDRQTDNKIEAAIWERMDLALASILGVKDRCALSPEDAGRLRGIVLRELNDFAELCVALVRSTSDDGVNELVVEMLTEIHSAVVIPSG